MADLIETEDNMEAFLEYMEEYTPTIPDEVIDYYLQKSGYQSPDITTKHVIALATQKFVTEVATDAFQYAKLRQQAATRASTASGNSKKAKPPARLVLTMDDLSHALNEYGVSITKPPYYADQSSTVKRHDNTGKTTPSRTKKGITTKSGRKSKPKEHG
eukprot:TRINITY_DN1620_c0_g1_i2.p1 TRINITY_DN1620_c0_g1~~TRINITY_DN1620_c0_g1_i2.p1  ORF type:complete len:159 (+),score=39.53 TRINITY_DN1620_c0_g1_i2:253-729(+)